MGLHFQAHYGGMVACLWQAFPIKQKEIRQLISNQQIDLQLTNQYGYGIPDFNLALNNGLFVEDLQEIL
jgi:hypothetical protein